MRVRRAYALLGVMFIIIGIGAVLAFNQSFIKRGDTGNITSVSEPMTFSLISSAFQHEGTIPKNYTCDGNKGLNPPLEITDVPAGTKSLVLIMDDPDVPKEVRPDGVFDHWVLFNIAPPAPQSSLEIFEGGPLPGTPGKNGRGENSYTGPCPPPQYEPREHRYIFAAYALDTELALAAGASKSEVLAEIEGHVLGEAQLIGRYRRPPS